MNKKKILGCVSIGLVSVALLAGCGNKSSGDESVIQVRMYEGGYGRDWFDTIARKFEEAEAAKGNNVKVELLSKNYSHYIGDDFVSRMESPNDNDFDLFILDGPDVNTVITESYDYLGTDSRTLLEDLTPLLDQPAIGFDGKEETQTIGSRLFTGYKESLEYHHSVPSLQDKWDGNIYALPWCDAMTGIVCNVSMLQEKGIDVPVTSDEFVAAVEAINDPTNNVYAFTYSGSTAPNYWTYLYQTWFAQYSGHKKFVDFIKCDPVGNDTPEDIKNNGYKVYQDPGFEKALEPLVKILDNKYMIPGSNGALYSVAQKNFADKSCAFMVNGDWMLKEMETYTNETQKANMKNAKMLFTPVLSSIGTEIGLASDSELSQLVKLIDQLKTNEEIQVSFPSLTGEKIDRVRNARTIHTGEGSNHLMMIPSYANAKDNAIKLIRYIYSEDGCNVFNEMCSSNLPLKFTLKGSVGDNVYRQSVIDIANCPTVDMVNENSEYNEIRKNAGMFIFNDYNGGSIYVFRQIIENTIDGIYATASEIAQAEIKKAQNSWVNWMGNFAW